MGIKIEADRRLNNLPQFRGGIIARVSGKADIAQAGIDAARMISSEPTTQDKDKRRENKQKAGPSPQQIAEEAAKGMLEAGRSPQEIEEVVARILEEKQFSPPRR